MRSLIASTYRCLDYFSNEVVNTNPIFTNEVRVKVFHEDPEISSFYNEEGDILEMCGRQKIMYEATFESEGRVFLDVGMCTINFWGANPSPF